jgi:hypothetical protein
MPLPDMLPVIVQKQTAMPSQITKSIGQAKRGPPTVDRGCNELMVSSSHSLGTLYRWPTNTVMLRESWYMISREREPTITGKGALGSL